MLDMVSSAEPLACIPSLSISVIPASGLPSPRTVDWDTSLNTSAPNTPRPDVVAKLKNECFKLGTLPLAWAGVPGFRGPKGASARQRPRPVLLGAL